MPRKASAPRKPVHEYHPNKHPEYTVWIAGTALLLVVSAVSVLQSTRIQALRQRLDAHSLQIARLSQKLGSLDQAVQACAPQAPVPAPAEATTTDQAQTPPPPPTSSHESSDGSHLLLMRGNPSPDGAMFAGYDETTRGRIGIAVDTMAQKRVRHIVLFTKTQSTGAGTPFEQLMSVRWQDSKTIQYDVLETVKGVLTPKSETVTIGF